MGYFLPVLRTYCFTDLLVTDYFRLQALVFVLVAVKVAGKGSGREWKGTAVTDRRYREARGIKSKG
jgi:hypothetical protein